MPDIRRDNKFTCAVVTPYQGLYSETFIRDQIASLPCNVLPVYGLRSTAQYQSSRICSPLAWLLTSGQIPHVPEAFVSLGERLIDRALARFWQRNHAQVVLAQFAIAGPSLLESARRAKIPLVVHCHGYDVYEDKTLAGIGTRYHEMFHAAAAIIAGSSEMRQHLVTLGAPPDKVHHIPVGVDTERFNPCRPETTPPVIVTVGRFVEKKAPHITILAFAKALKSCPEARLIMIGDGPLLNACKQMTTGLGIGERVFFKGALPHADVRQLLVNSRAFAQHSVRALNGDSEGTALSVLEAAASGLPVIASSHAGIKDSMVDGETGFLCSELDIEGMARAMVRVLTDEALAQQLGQNGRKRIVAEFSLERSIGRLYKLLRECARS